MRIYDHPVLHVAIYNWIKDWWSIICSGLLVILMVSVMKTSKLSSGACFLGRGALDRVSARNEKGS